jgi:hypothetical protein
LEREPPEAFLLRGGFSMSVPEIPPDPPPTNGGGNLLDYFRSRYGRTSSLIFGLTAGGVAAIRTLENQTGAWAIVALVSFAIVASIYCAKNRIH